MHRRTYQHNYGAAAILGIVSAIGFVALLPSPTVSALSPSVTIAIGNTESTGSIDARNSSAYGTMEVPVRISTYDTEKFEIYIRSIGKDEARDINAGTWSPTTTYDRTGTEKLVGDTATNTATISPLSNTTFPSGASTSDFQNLTTSTWGYRWIHSTLDTTPTNPNDKTVSTITQDEKDSLNTVNYKGILPNGTETRLLGENNAPIYTGRGNYSERLVFQFGANIADDIVSDNYTGNIMLSVLATPLQTTMFDITNMQDMSTQICDATPTPSTTAHYTITNKQTRWDTTTKKWVSLDNPSTTTTSGMWVGEPDNSDNSMEYVALTANDFGHILDQDSQDNTNWSPDNGTHTYTTYSSADYVPETILIDSRDSKPYLVRKLADGNCWMSSNLDYQIDTTKVDSQLKNSQLSDYNGIWNNMAVQNTQTSYSPSWGTANDDTAGLRSFSWSGYTPDDSTTGSKAFSIKNPSDFTFSGAASGALYEYRGTLYNWNN